MDGINQGVPDGQGFITSKQGAKLQMSQQSAAQLTEYGEMRYNQDKWAKEVAFLDEEGIDDGPRFDQAHQMLGHFRNLAANMAVNNPGVKKDYETAKAEALGTTKGEA